MPVFLLILLLFINLKKGTTTNNRFKHDKNKTKWLRSKFYKVPKMDTQEYHTSQLSIWGFQCRCRCALEPSASIQAGIAHIFAETLMDCRSCIFWWMRSPYLLVFYRSIETWYHQLEDHKKGTLENKCKRMLGGCKEPI